MLILLFRSYQDNLGLFVVNIMRQYRDKINRVRPLTNTNKMLFDKKKGKLLFDPLNYYSS